MSKAKTSHLRLFSRAFKLSFVNLWRNKLLSLASIVVIATILFILNIVLSINFTVQNTLGELSQKIDLVIYVQEKDPSQISELLQEVKDLEGVIDAKYTTKEEALEQVAKLHPETAEFLKGYQIDNPLPASISVTTTTPDRQSAVKNYVKSKYPNLISKINENNQEQNKRNRRIVQNLKSVQDFTGLTLFWTITVLLMGGILIILNAIQITIFARKKELFIMRFIGASHSFIRLPYILESIWYAILAVVLSLFMLKALTLAAPESISTLELWTSDNSQRSIILLNELVYTIIVSAISSFIAIEMYLRKRLLS